VDAARQPVTWEIADAELAPALLRLREGRAVEEVGAA
jgi:hypothetical protein